MEFSLKNDSVLCIHEKIQILFSDSSLLIDGFNIDFPGEYEKSNILVEAEEVGEHFMFICVFGGKKVTYLPSSIESLTTDMITKIGDVDVLIIEGRKELQGAIEKVEPNVLIPYGSARSALLGAFGQSIEPVEKRVLKAVDYDSEQTAFISLLD